MKVLLVNKFHYRKGGSETYYFTLAEALKQAGHDVVFFAMEDEKNLPCPQKRYFVSNASVTGGIKSKMKMILHLTYSREAYRKMTQLLQAEKPDLVILNLVHKQLTMSVVDAIRDFDSQIPIFWTMHDLIAVCPSYTMRDGSGNICEKCLGGNYLHCVKNKCMKGSTLMSVLSAYEAAYIRRRKWYDDVDLYICPSDFHRGKLTEAAFSRRSVITMRNPLPVDTVFENSGTSEGYILYFGRLSPEKGVHTLIEAAKLCNCRLLVVGTGPQEEELKSLAEGAPNIEFKGFQTGDTLRNFVKNSRCVVIPSACYENGPYSAMEAMALGRPLIVADRGGLPELVEDGKNGYVYGHSPQQLADAIIRMQNLSEDAYRDMCSASFDKAKCLFDAASYVETLEKRYHEIKETKNV